jgi:hypothetical protein
LEKRRCPDPGGQPGYLRVDTVPRGDTQNARGVFHINAVDEVTQWEIAAAVPRISESYLEPVLTAVLAQFPSVIHRFYSDNGSEFINHERAAHFGADYDLRSCAERRTLNRNRSGRCAFRGRRCRAKKIVAGLLRETGVDAVDAGPLRNARFVELAMILLVQLAYPLGMGVVGIKLFRAK